MKRSGLRRLVNVVSWSLSTKTLTILLGGMLLLGAVLLVNSIASAEGALRSEVQARFATAALGKLQSVTDLMVHQFALLRGMAADPVLIEACERANADDAVTDELALQAENAVWRGAEDSSELVQGVIDPALNAATAQVWAHIVAEPGILEVVVTDSRGAIVAATARPDDYTQAHASWWRPVFNHGLGNLYLGIDPGAAHLDIAVPVISTEAGERRFAGAVHARLDLTAVVQAMNAVQLSPLQEALMTDASGRILALTSSLPGAELGEVHESWIGRDYTLSQRQHSHEASMADGTPVLLGHSSMRYLDIHREDEAAVLQQLDWILFTYQPMPTAYAEIRRMTERILAVGLTVLVAVAAGSYLWSRSVSAPLEQITGFAQTHIVSWIGDADEPGAQGGEQGVPPPLTVEELQAGHGPERAWIYPQPEAGVLGLALNRLLEEQESLLAALRARDATQERERQRRQRDVVLTTSIGDVVSVAGDVDTLTQRVVGLIRDHYNLYFVGFYLSDVFNAEMPRSATPALPGEVLTDVGRWAVLHAGTGEAGHTLLARGHRVAIHNASSVGGLAAAAGAQQPELVGLCLATGRMQVTRDLGAGRHRSDSDVLPYARSEIVVPLRSRGLVLGAITALSYQSDTFDESTAAIFQIIADRVAVAIDSIRLYAESQQATARLQRAYGELSREAWRQAVGQGVGRGYEARATGVRPLAALAPDHWPAEARNAWRGIDSPTTGTAKDEAGSDAFRMALPIRVRGGAGADGATDQASDVIGVLEVSKLAAAGDWTPGEQDQLRALAVQLGQALENARLYEVTQQNALEEQMVGDITRRMRETLSVDTVLQTAVRELQALLRLNEVEVRVGGDWTEMDSDRVASNSEPGNGRGVG